MMIDSVSFCLTPYPFNQQPLSLLSIITNEGMLSADKSGNTDTIIKSEVECNMVAAINDSIVTNKAVLVIIPKHHNQHTTTKIMSSTRSRYYVRLK